MQEKMPEIKPGMLVKVPHIVGDGVDWVLVVRADGVYVSGVHIKTAMWQDGTRNLAIETMTGFCIKDILEVYDYSFPGMPTEVMSTALIWDIVCGKEGVRDRYCIWRKIPVREMTVSEISRALGYDVKVVKG